MERQKSVTKSIDWMLVILLIAIVSLGILNLYSAAYDENHSFILDFKSLYGKQIFWVGIGLFIGFIVFLIDSKYIRELSVPAYLFTVILLIAVLFTKPINGARSWLGIGSFGIQPSEFAKLGMALIMSYLISNISTKTITTRTVLFLNGVLLATMVLILLQNDTGTFLVFTAFLFVLYREGITFDPIILFFTNAIFGLRFKSTWVGVHFIPVLFVVIFFSITSLFFADTTHSLSIGSFLLHEVPDWIFILLLLTLSASFALFIILKLVTDRNKKRLLRIVIISYLSFSSLTVLVTYGYNNVLQPHQKERIDLWLGKVDSEQQQDKADYNRNRAMAAVGSGGIAGNGYQNAQLASPESGHVPESETDFIFCVYAEEWGFLGSFIVVTLFTLLLIRIIVIAERQRSRFTRVYAYCVAMIIFYHFGINIGMNLGIVPIIGIPLPFFSYGGSSMLSFTVMMLILLKLDAQRKEVLF
ncbi:MAG: rod shape-determining protein RodA [Lishizhenia sp.]